MNKRIAILFCVLLSILVGGCGGASTGRVVALAAPPPGGPADARPAFNAGMTLALQGDMKAALPRFTAIDASGLNPEQQGALAQVLANFAGNRTAHARSDLDPWTAKVLDAYQVYWSRVMLRVVPDSVGERELAATLAPLVGVGAGTGAPVGMDALEPQLEAQLKARGYFSLHGVTSPYREFLLWRRQIDKRYEVDLPQGREVVSVALLEDFISLGWTGFATGDYYHTAGWATPERLFCVRMSYDLDSESFRISYLAHEGQHFSDYKHFPHLEAHELEYRAKLVEIAYADTTLVPLLKSFADRGSDQLDNPHGYANRRVIDDLARTLHVAAADTTWRTTVPPATIRAAAVRLLNEDSRRLERGAAP